MNREQRRLLTKALVQSDDVKCVGKEEINGKEYLCIAMMPLEYEGGKKFIKKKLEALVDVKIHNATFSSITELNKCDFYIKLF